MSSVQYLREFVNQRLTAAAEEIFGVFEKTIVEYEAELERQRRLLDIVWKPEIKLHRIEIPQHHVCMEEEEVLTEQQLWDQQRNSSLDQEDPESPQIKEEQEEVEVKQEINAFMLIHAHEESEHCETEANSEQQLLSYSSAVDESQDQRGSQHVEPPSTGNVESQPEKRSPSNSNVNITHTEFLQQAFTEEEEEEEEEETEQQFWDHEEPEVPQTKEEQEAQCTGSEGDELKVKQETDNFMMIPAYEELSSSEHSSPISESQCNTLIGKTMFRCSVCGKDCKYQSLLKIHERIHTGERPYVCDFCGKRFSQKSAFNDHLRLHTGEKPYLCKICGKVLRSNSGLVVHLRTHTGEKPYLCNTCGKTFSNVSVLKRHTRIHTGEKPYQCNICGKRFNQTSSLKVHLNVHTDERPFICNTCGKRFNHNKSLYVHVKMHEGENSYVCDTCGKTFRYKKSLNVHLKTHSNEKENS